MLRALDQTLLPDHEVELELRDGVAVVEAIRRLAIRGAPLIGVAGAYGLALEVAAEPTAEHARLAAEGLRSARPTAVNLSYAVDRVLQAALSAAPGELAGDFVGYPGHCCSAGRFDGCPFVSQELE